MFRAACLLILSLLAVATVAVPARAEPRNYVLDEEHLAISFLVTHLGFAKVLGQFLTASGSFVYDAEARTVENIRVEIDAKSVFSNHKRRDIHVRSKDFLHAKTHPVITFVGTKAEPTGEKTGKVHGDLTIRGVTKPVVLDVTLNKSGRYPFLDKHYAIGISARTTIERAEWGMTYAVQGDIVGNEVEIILEFEAIRQDG